MKGQKDGRGRQTVAPIFLPSIFLPFRAPSVRRPRGADIPVGRASANVGGERQGVSPPVARRHTHPPWG
jgi:hypothetical protein